MVLNKGVAFYTLLKFNGNYIMQAIAEEIKLVTLLNDLVKESKIEEAQIQVLPIFNELL